MKLTSIITLLTLVVMVKGAWWAAAVSPVILSIGALLTAMSPDDDEVWNGLRPRSTPMQKPQKDSIDDLEDHVKDFESGEMDRPLTKEESEQLYERIM